MDQLAKTIHVKSCTCTSGNFSSDQHRSPTSVLPTSNKRRKSRGGRNSLTLIDPELEELKGFRDLGFEFSDEDRNDPNLVSIVPGLCTLPRGNKDIEIQCQRQSQRPYLSEAWEVMDKNEAVMEMTLAMNRRIRDISYSDENSMKEQIKLWARSVASAIR